MELFNLNPARIQTGSFFCGVSLCLQNADYQLLASTQWMLQIPPAPSERTLRIPWLITSRLDYHFFLQPLIYFSVLLYFKAICLERADRNGNHRAQHLIINYFSELKTLFLQCTECPQSRTQRSRPLLYRTCFWSHVLEKSKLSLPIGSPGSPLLAFTVSLCKELKKEDPKHSLSPNTNDPLACHVVGTLSSWLGNHEKAQHVVTHVHFKRSFQSLPGYCQTQRSRMQQCFGWSHIVSLETVGQREITE